MIDIALIVGKGLLQETLVKIAKKLKKNNVAVDIVSLAAEEENAPKLEAFQVNPLWKGVLSAMLE